MRRDFARRAKDACAYGVADYDREAEAYAQDSQQVATRRFGHHVSFLGRRQNDNALVRPGSSLVFNLRSTYHSITSGGRKRL
jgi:hypothetical protein